MTLGHLASILGFEEEDYRELVELFVETSMSDLEELRSAIEEGNPDQARNAAHSLKGAASNLGLLLFSEAAREIEARAREGSLEGAAEVAEMLGRKLAAMAKRVVQ